MRKLFAFVLLAALSAGSAEARERYEGFFQINSKLGTCTDYDPVGDRLTAKYLPALVADNGSQTQIGLFYQFGARALNINGKVNVVPPSSTSGFKAAASVNVFEGWNSVPNQQIRYNSQSPVNIAANTPNITIKGQIKNYDFMPGCIINFVMILTKSQRDLP